MGYLRRIPRSAIITLVAGRYQLNTLSRPALISLPHEISNTNISKTRIFCVCVHSDIVYLSLSHSFFHLAWSVLISQ